MKIGQVCPYNIFRAGGVQDHIFCLTKELEKSGHQVKIIAPKGDDKRKADNIILLGRSTKFLFNKTKIELSIAEYDEIHSMLLKEKFDLLHIHEPWVPALAIQVLYECGVATVGTFHSATTNTMFINSIEKLLKPFAKTIVESCNQIIAVSQTATEYINEISEREINIIPNGIDLVKFNIRINPLPKYSSRNVKILFLGRLDKRKGVIYLVKAFRKLIKKYKNIELLIAGDGDQVYKIKKYVKKHKIKNIKFLGYIEENDKVALYRTCDIFCSPALYGESFGLVLLEAMACGKPIVAYANDGYKMVLKGKGARFLAESKNITDLAKKLEKLIVNDDLRYEMTRWGLEEVKKYSWNHITKEIVQIYKKAIKDNKIDKILKRRQEKGKYFKTMFKELSPKLYEEKKVHK